MESTPARFSGLSCYRGLIPIEEAPELAKRQAVTVWLGPGEALCALPGLRR